MRTVQNIHAHELHSIIPRKTARRNKISTTSTISPVAWPHAQPKKPKRVAWVVKLVAGVAGEVEAEGLVVVEDRGVDGAVEEGEDRVRGRWNYGGLDRGQEEIVVGLEDGAGWHGGVVNDEVFLVVVDRLDFVVAGWGGEEEVGGAVEHATELRRTAAVVEAERIVYGDGAAGGAARGDG